MESSQSGKVFWALSGWLFLKDDASMIKFGKKMVTVDFCMVTDIDMQKKSCILTGQSKENGSDSGKLPIITYNYLLVMR